MVVVVLGALGGVLVALVGSVPADDPRPVPPTVAPTPPVEADPDPGPDPRPPADPEPEPQPEEPFRLPDRDFGDLPPPHSDHPVWVALQQPVLHQARFPVQQGCPPPSVIRTMGELRGHTGDDLACVQAAWKPGLAALGLPTHDVPLYFYAGSSANSPCGTWTAPAFYCSAGGGAIYMGEDALRGGRDPLTVSLLVRHEYGHHLQSVTGVLGAFYQLPEQNEMWRRLELQATCLSTGQLRTARSYTLDREFYESLEPHLRTYVDDGIHGHPDSQAYWGMRGFHAEHAVDCNTWTVGPQGVR